MATILLGAVGAVVGAGFGGTVLGLSGAVIGRAVGATLGRVIDQRLLGAGSEPVEIGRVERFRLMGASDGAPLARVWGRTRVAGQVIWASRFKERVRKSGGKGTPQPETKTFSYSVSIALALCEGEIAGIGRIWADGMETDPTTMDLRVYPGDEAQLPDPKIEAVEGAGRAPSYRGLAYVVIEDLDLSRFGNRVPQLNFEVLRHSTGGEGLREAIRAVALVPGTGEYALATNPVRMRDGLGKGRMVNVNTVSGQTDFATSLAQLRTELPNVTSVSLVVSWFGDDLRAGTCRIRPKVEQTAIDGNQDWRSGGINRAGAQTVPLLEGSPVYGGTPSDASVMQAIAAIRAGGQEVMFYPFVLMEQLAANGLPDPWSDAPDQPVLPWRGRITASIAPGRPGTPDRTAAAEAEVAAFFGSVQPGHVSTSGTTVTYSGPPEDWGYRRFILHYARLCALAGGVDAFCIGSELCGLTRIRGQGDNFPTVAALKALAADVRGILGPGTKITYAADWSEYFGYHVDGNVYFNLDPLWADPEIDFIGIDNYMPLSDWRGRAGEADASAGSIYDLGYLRGNVAGGEGYDWYYDGEEGASAQRRLPISDGDFGEPWVFRYKDLKGWWSNLHFERIDGARAEAPTDWVPGSKPFRFTEYGCAAIDKGTNQPNRFLDPKSSESALPRASDGRRDDFIPIQYFRAVSAHWADPEANPASLLYPGRMVDMDRAHAWAWDARPFPAFPARGDLWSDGPNYAHGHWLNGRAMNQALAHVVAEIAMASGVPGADTDRAYGVVRGFAAEGGGTARSVLQPVMLAHAVDSVERDGRFYFISRGRQPQAELDTGALAESSELEGPVEFQRAAEAEMAGRVRLNFIEAEGDFLQRQAEATFPDDAARGVALSEVPLVLTADEGRAIAERWLAEARSARDSARFALPPSAADIGPGDSVRLAGAVYRIDRTERAEATLVDAVRVEPSVYLPAETAEARQAPPVHIAAGPIAAMFLDLPLLRGSEVPHAPHVAVAADPWPGTVAVWRASEGSDGFTLNALIEAPALIGQTETALAAAPPGVWDRGAPLRVRLVSGALESVSSSSVLNGANVLAIGDDATGNWEVIQFAEATLVAPLTWDISLRLRGQGGTDATAPLYWPAGSKVVLLDGTLPQADLPLSERGLARTWRVGRGDRGFDGPDAVESMLSFDGIGLRPYAPCHLRIAASGSDAVVSWVRRTRLDGDNWASVEVPLAEEREAYQVRVLSGTTVLRTVEVASPAFTYSSAMRSADGLVGPATFSVAQLSVQFGPGPFRSVTEAV